MNRESGYNWGHLWAAVIGSVAGIILAIWKHGDLNKGHWAVICIIILFLLIKQTFPLCKVLITESEIHIFYISPLRVNQKLRFDEIDSYAEVEIQRKGKKIPIIGFLRLKNRKKIMLPNVGTKNLTELSSILSELFAQEGTEDG